MPFLITSTRITRDAGITPAMGKRSARYGKKLSKHTVCVDGERGGRMVTCPHCGVSSRQDPTALKVTEIMVATPLGSFSLAGQQMKVPVRTMHRLGCRCGWHVDGYVNFTTGQFDGRADTQHFPTEGRADGDG